MSSNSFYMHIIREAVYDLLLGHPPEAMHCNKTLVIVSSEQGLTKTIQNKREGLTKVSRKGTTVLMQV